MYAVLALMNLMCYYWWIGCPKKALAKGRTTWRHGTHQTVTQIRQIGREGRDQLSEDG